MGDIQKPDKKSTKSLILRKVMLQLLKKKKHIQWTHIEI